MPALFKNNAENNDNGAAVDQKSLIANNDDGANTPAKVLCCRNLAKTLFDVEVDLEILNQVDQEHQVRQKLGDAISDRLALVIKKH